MVITLAYPQVFRHALRRHGRFQDRMRCADGREIFALLISKRFIFSAVHGVSRVGFPIASALQKYCTRAPEARLIVDDVLTTGLAMEMARKNQADIGVVLFARGPCPDWVWPVFQLWYTEC